MQFPGVQPRLSWTTRSDPVKISRRARILIVAIWFAGCLLLVLDEAVWHGDLACRTVQAQHETPTKC